MIDAQTGPENSVARFKMTLAYVGTKFHGWQVQKDLRTVQGCLEDILASMIGHSVTVHGSGRTDAGVHARGQVAHFDVLERWAHVPWQQAFNAQLPPDVSILNVERVPQTFHARYSAASKEYVYTLWTEPSFVFPERRPYVWCVRGLNFCSMERAAGNMVGRHDFACFQNRGTPMKSTVRTLERVQFEPGETAYERKIRFVADGFLKQMVRNLVGALVAVGRGALTLDTIPDLLAQKNRCLMPETAPAWALCLDRVVFDEP